MKSAILRVTTDVVPSPSFQLSIILPPIPTKVTLIIIMVGMAKFGILVPSIRSVRARISLVQKVKKVSLQEIVTDLLLVISKIKR